MTSSEIKKKKPGKVTELQGINNCSNICRFIYLTLKTNIMKIKKFRWEFSEFRFIQLDLLDLDLFLSNKTLNVAVPRLK